MKKNQQNLAFTSKPRAESERGVLKSKVRNAQNTKRAEPAKRHRSHEEVFDRKAVERAENEGMTVSPRIANVLHPDDAPRFGYESGLPDAPPGITRDDQKDRL